MIRAYDNQYLDDAMKCLGEAFDYAANVCEMDMDRFLDLFIVTGYAEQFAAGVPKIVSGLSGTELVMDVIAKSKADIDVPEAQIDYDYSAQYWCGWVLAYYQWYTGRSFKEIAKHITMREIEKLYPTLHEADEKKFVDTVNRIIRKKNPPTRLQTQRRISGYTQKELSEKVGKSRSAIANAMRLLDLPEDVLDMVASLELSAGHARTLLGLKNDEDKIILANRAIDEDMSVRRLEEEVKRANKPKKPVIEEDDEVPFVDYFREMEIRVQSHLGRKVKIDGKGRNKTITLFYEDNEDLDEILLSLCGKDFLDQV